MTATLSACRWHWCTKTFPDHASLIDHVETDHIAKAEPVKRRDVPLLQRVEDGASLPESVVPRVWASVTDSQSQSQTITRRVERAVMTDPILVPTIRTIPDTPQQDQAVRWAPALGSGASTPTPSPSLMAEENVSLVKFSEMRGTPSPAPSLIPSSPGTTVLVSRIKQNAVFPVSPRPSRHATPGAHRSPEKPSPKPSPLKETSGEKGVLYTTLSASMDENNVDRGGTDAAGAEGPPSSQEVVESQLLSTDDVDDLHEMDVDSVVLNGLQPQWQPQSQLPLPDGSLSNDSLPVSTINPTQLHAPLSYVLDSHRSIREPESEDGVLRGSSPSKLLTSPILRSSDSQRPPRSLRSTPHPPSPSTLDISNITTTTDTSPSAIRATPRASSRVPQSPSMSASFSQSGSDQQYSMQQSQASNLYMNEVPFDSGYGYGYGDGYGDSQQPQTQAPLKQNSYESSWSQG